MAQIDFENERGVRLKKAETNTDAVNLQQLIDTKEDLIKRIDELTKYVLGIGGLYPLTVQFTAGENLSIWDICYLKTDGKMYRANATNDSKSTTLLTMASFGVLANEIGKFYLYGRVALAGLTMGSVYYLDVYDGSYSITPPNVSSNIVRVIGYAIAQEIFFFNPDPTWVKIK
jgi:hypothetical protein